MLQEAFELYNKKYSELKPTRNIELIPGLGTVEIELELDDGRVICDEVPPLAAAIIQLFAVRPKWSLREMAQQLEVSKICISRVPSEQSGSRQLQPPSRGVLCIG